MFSALHPLLLWGVAGIAVPILIHLLLRQKPRPRPWAAMRWLLAAAKAAQRRYRLTNLLLLILRCLIVALLSLAVARLAIAGLGGGDHLVIVVDRSASMAARGADPGPLAAAKAALTAAGERRDLSYRAVTVIAVGERAEVVASGASPAVAIRALATIEAGELPGGLDDVISPSAAGAGAGAGAGNDAGDGDGDAADAQGSRAEAVTAATGAGADVVLVSDFQQDDGSRLAGLLGARARQVSRWRVGQGSANAVVAGIHTLSDLLPGQPGEIVLRVRGAVRGATLAVDDGIPTEVNAHPAAGVDGATLLRIATPPLGEGEHRLRVVLGDDGLAYDNVLELPIRVRPSVATVAVQERPDYLGAALHADRQALGFTGVRPAQFSGVALPSGGLVALRAAVADGARLRDWVRGGGVLWAGYDLLRADPALRDAIAGVERGDRAEVGGTLISGDKEYDEFFEFGRIATVGATTLPAGAEVLLRAGAAPVVVAVPDGRGYVVVELADLATDPVFPNLKATPVWVAQTARRLTARLGTPPWWTAGAPAPASAALRRAGQAVTARLGEPLLASPGAWQSEAGSALGGSPVIVLPDPGEGLLERSAPEGTVAALDQALPRRPTTDFGLWLALAALAVLIGEGLFAGWAGRMYGR